MYIGSGLKSTSGFGGRQQNSSAPAPISGNSGFSQAVYQVYLKTEDMLYSGGNGTGLSFYLKYAPESTEDNPVVIAKGVDENGQEFEKKIFLNKVNPRNATIVEMRVLEAHHKVDKGAGLTSLPMGTGQMRLNDRSDFIACFEKEIRDMKTLKRYDLQAFYMRNLNTYLELL